MNSNEKQRVILLIDDYNRNFKNEYETYGIYLWSEPEKQMRVASFTCYHTGDIVYRFYTDIGERWLKYIMRLAHTRSYKKTNDK